MTETEPDYEIRTEVEFIVYGEPRPQGSKRAFAGRNKHGQLKVRVVDDNPHTKSWRQEVAIAARAAWNRPLLDRSVPVRLSLCFVRPRPESHYGTGKNSGVLKATAPAYPTQRPDTLKLARAVEDALTGVVWTDDSQAVRHELSKDWGAAFCVVVKVETLPSVRQ